MTQPSEGPADLHPVNLEGFFARLRSVNPFLTNRVDRVQAQHWVDVGDIHDAEFRRIVALGRQAQAEGRGVGVVAWGEAGVGKSHLLRRLGRWAGESQEACYIYLHNLQATPERLPRAVLRSVLHYLGAGRRPPWWNTPLLLLLNRVLKALPRREPDSPPTWARLQAEYGRLLDDLAAGDLSHGVLFDRTSYEVLFRFFRAAHPSPSTHDDRAAAVALRWLSGETLAAEESAQLGLRPEAAHVQDNQHVKQVLVAIAQLAGLAGQLLLLCFDQVDNLDEAQIQALSRFLHDLLDSAGNLLVVTTGVRQTMLDYLRRGVITETSWDRLGQFEVSPGRIDRPRGRELLAARLRQFLLPYLALEQVEDQVRQDPLFPLGSDWFEARLRELPDFRARDLLTWAGERWQEQQAQLERLGGVWLQQWRNRPASPVPRPPPSAASLTALIDRAVAGRLATEIAARLRDRDMLPADDDHLHGVVCRLLQQCRGEARYGLVEVRQVPPPRSGPPSPYHLILRRLGPDGREVRTGVVFLVTDQARTVAAALRRLLVDRTPPGRVLLVTDERQPLSLGPRSRERLDELDQRGPAAFRHLPVCFEEYAALDALQAVAALARAGDLEVETTPGERRPVREEEVIDSYRRHGRYQEHPLLRELLGSGEVPGEDQSPIEVTDRDAREFIMAQLALTGEVALGELAERLLRSQPNGPGPGDLQHCLDRLQEVAADLGNQGLVQTTPDEQRLCLPRAQH